MATKLFLIRHGETSWNAIGRWQGWAPIPLNDVGRKQARSLGNFLQEKHDVKHIYSSDLPRAAETAQIVADILAVPITLDERLRGPHVGAWQGLTRDDVVQWDGARFEAYLKDLHHFQRPGGESLQQTASRCLSLIDDKCTLHANDSFAIVTHSGALYGILNELKLHIPDDTNMKNTSVTLLEFDDGNWSLVSIAQVP